MPFCWFCHALAYIIIETYYLDVHSPPNAEAAAGRGSRWAHHLVADYSTRHKISVTFVVAK